MKWSALLLVALVACASAKPTAHKKRRLPAADNLEASLKELIRALEVRSESAPEETQEPPAQVEEEEGAEAPIIVEAGPPEEQAASVEEKEPAGEEKEPAAEEKEPAASAEEQEPAGEEPAVEESPEAPVEPEPFVEPVEPEPTAVEPAAPAGEETPVSGEENDSVEKALEKIEEEASEELAGEEAEEEAEGDVVDEENEDPELPDFLKTKPFRQTVQMKLDGVLYGIWGLWAMPFFESVIETMDHMDKICWHVAEWESLYGDHMEEVTKNDIEQQKEVDELAVMEKVEKAEDAKEKERAMKKEDARKEARRLILSQKRELRQQLTKRQADFLPENPYEVDWDRVNAVCDALHAHAHSRMDWKK